MLKKKQKKKVKRFDKYLLLSWRKLWIIIVSAFVAIMLHNLTYGLGIYFGGEDFWGASGDEPFFFILTMLIILYFFITIIYTLIKKIKLF
jgi:preprotein translocase subunit SecG